jgi:hypothetical protein
MFVKGKSGNPGGRKKNGDTAADMIRKAITDGDWRAMAVSLMDVVIDPEKNGRDKAACYNALADRAFGKPQQKQVIQMHQAPPIDEQALKEMQSMIGVDLIASGIVTEENSDDTEGE